MKPAPKKPQPVRPTAKKPIKRPATGSVAYRKSPDTIGTRG